MKRDEALDIVGMLMANWPGSHWSHASAEAYTNAIEPLDADITTRAVLRAVNEMEFYPKVSVLREFVRIEKRMSEKDDPIERSLRDTPSQLMPAWVRGWCVSRVRHRDFRVWPEQREFLEGEPMPSDVCNTYMVEGADLPVEQLFKTMIGTV